jgi:hypothetical protein
LSAAASAAATAAAGALTLLRPDPAMRLISWSFVFH